MRRLVWLVVVLATLWCGWWALASWNLRNGTDAWLQDRRAEGWQAEATFVDVSGFPTHLILSMINPIMADPDTGVVFNTDTLLVTSPAWWPGDLVVTLPGETLDISTPAARYRLAAESGRAVLRLEPGTSLELEHASLTSKAWQLAAPAGTLWAADALDLTLQQTTVDSHGYAFNADAPAFAPGGAIRSALRIPKDWPVAFDSLTATGSITLDRPIDRRTIEKARPQPRQIDLHLVEVAWGPLLLRTSANLTISEQGLISGQLSLQARNWRSMLDLAERSGALPSSIRPQLQNVLAALARGSGNSDALDVTLQVQDGNLFMGFVPLGRLPPLIVR